MSQNRSSAVMQQRHEPHDSLDYFPTPPWATRALCEHLAMRDGLGELDVWEPASGEGHMARPLAEYFRSVVATDVHDYRSTFDGQEQVCDFLCAWDHPPVVEAEGVDWIITNPPFRLGEEFVEQARSVARRGVAVFVRSAFLEGTGRYKELFWPAPPAMICQFTERVPLVKGRLDGTASTATSYCWIIWMAGHVGATEFHWISPCRKRLERAGDYPAERVEPTPLPLLGGSGCDPP